MNFADFEAAARDVFDSIPARYRKGVDGLVVERSTIPHPALPEVFTLGECSSEYYPSEFGGPGEVRSLIVLYHGSFLAASRGDERWDWEEEIFETVTHELKHHLESLAVEDSLEELDYAEDQNFARREGERFDPFFYRAGSAVGERVWEVDGDTFIEVPVGRREAMRGSVEVEWGGRVHRVPLSPPLADVGLVRLGGSPGAGDEVIAVLARRTGVRDWIRALLRPRPARVEESEAPYVGDPRARPGRLP